MIDVAPFEFFSWTNKDSLTMLGFPPSMIEEALDIKLHWVSEDGDMASLKSNAKIMPTVRNVPFSALSCRTDSRYRTRLHLVHPLTSYLWALMVDIT